MQALKLDKLSALSDKFSHAPFELIDAEELKSEEGDRFESGY